MWFSITSAKLPFFHNIVSVEDRQGIQRPTLNDILEIHYSIVL